MRNIKLLCSRLRFPYTFPFWHNFEKALSIFNILLLADAPSIFLGNGIAAIPIGTAERGERNMAVYLMTNGAISYVSQEIHFPAA